MENGIFPHQCEEEGCEIVVEFDDEPMCFTHSPDSGSFVPGYSAYKKAPHNFHAEPRCAQGWNLHFEHKTVAEGDVSPMACSIYVREEPYAEVIKMLVEAKSEFRCDVDHIPPCHSVN